MIRTYKYLKEEILFDQFLAFLKLELGLVKIKLSDKREAMNERKGESMRGGLGMD